MQFNTGRTEPYFWLVLIRSCLAGFELTPDKAVPRLTTMEQFLIVVLAREGERTVRQLARATKLCQADIGSHLRSLVKKGRVMRRRDGRGNAIYLIDPEALADRPE
jgi:DNA-binding MarR family transcriptional regulator